MRPRIIVVRHIDVQSFNMRKTVDGKNIELGAVFPREIHNWDDYRLSFSAKPR